jgi:hypothetical protein
MDWVVTLFVSSYSALPSGESNSQVVNLNNLILIWVEETPVVSVLTICSLLLKEMSKASRVMYFLIKQLFLIRNIATSLMQNSVLSHFINVEYTQEPRDNQ